MARGMEIRFGSCRWYGDHRTVENDMSAKVIAVSVSAEKGMQKSNVPDVSLVADWGIDGDAHAGPWHRQVSLLATESIDKIRAKGVDVGPGAFAENITTSGIDIWSSHIGDHLHIGDTVLEVTQIGKECHHGCAIREAAGDCVMPREGIFARVINGGSVAPGSAVRRVASTSQKDDTAAD
jgi:MOSC domain-containing protein YiiM